MTARAYYNEFDPYAAAWLRNLIAAGHIAPGDVDDRSIKDVSADDLKGYTQCHFFAGIGVWSHALRLAGWADDSPVWTGSCPCQPFSAAGKQKGFDDARHLWPDWFRLIDERRPRIVFGEQVAHKSALPWVDAVCADLEGTGYSVGANDICAPGVGAPHIRQRLYFVADTDDARSQGRGERRDGTHKRVTGSRGMAGELADADGAGRNECTEHDGVAPAGGEVQHRNDAGRCGRLGKLADTDGRDSGAEGIQRSGQHGQQPQDSVVSDVAGLPGPTNGFWGPADWIYCRDHKWRPVEPNTFPLAHGAPARVGRLRAYGNAIVAPLAAEFIRSYLACRP